MRLKPLDDTLIELEEHMEPASEDSWLNDVGPSSRPQPGINNEKNFSFEGETIKPPSELDTYSLIDYAELLSLQDTPTLVRQALALPQPELHIGPAHRLWPVMLRLSERIWQEVHRKPGAVDVREPALIGFVRSRSLDVLRTDGEFTGQVCDLVEAEQLLDGVVEEVLGYGPLEVLMRSEDITEITAVGPHLTYVVRDGKLQEVPDCFEDERHMLRVIENMLRYAGRHIEASWPIADMRLLDGTSVYIVMPPFAVHGPTITIRKSSRRLLSMMDLVQLGSMTQEMADFLTACVQARLNIIVCGGIGSGRTTLLNALGSCMPTERRIVTIEDVIELQLSQRHVVALESRLTDPDSVKRVTMRDLVLHTLRLCPEHLIVGECQGSEIVELLQAMYNGCSGVLTSLYAHNLRDCLTRLEVMCLAGGMNLPLTTIRAQIAAALDVVVYLSRLRDGSHKVMNIAEVHGVEDDIIRLQNIFHYQDTEVDMVTGKVQGMFRSGGFRPNCLAKFEAANIQLPRGKFVPLPGGQSNGRR